MGTDHNRLYNTRVRFNRFLMSLDPVFAAVFYVGFVVVALMVILIYAHHLTSEVGKVNGEQNEKILLSEIAACHRSNAIRQNWNRSEEALDNLMTVLLNKKDVTIPEIQALYQSIFQTRKLTIINCEAVIRDITGEIFKNVEK